MAATFIDHFFANRLRDDMPQIEWLMHNIVVDYVGGTKVEAE